MFVEEHDTWSFLMVFPLQASVDYFKVMGVIQRYISQPNLNLLFLAAGVCS